MCGKIALVIDPCAEPLFWEELSALHHWGCVIHCHRPHGHPRHDPRLPRLITAVGRQTTGESHRANKRSSRGGRHSRAFARQAATPRTFAAQETTCTASSSGKLRTVSSIPTTYSVCDGLERSRLQTRHCERPHCLLLRSRPKRIGKNARMVASPAVLTWRRHAGLLSKPPRRL